MSDDNIAEETALRLKRLIEEAELSKPDRFLAERCLRRLAQPLRLTVFGTDAKHAISLINLMIGQPVVSPSINRARIQFVYGKTAYARVQFRGGSQERVEGADFRRLFDNNPTRVRIYVDLPVLKKLSILVAAEENPEALCADVEKTLPPADISLWAGDALTAPLNEVWKNLPDRLRDHSYLVLSPNMDFDSWKPIAQEFVEILRVDPRRAQEAKSGENGVDKEEFRESGGAQLVKTIKREIEVLVQSACDAAEVLFLRYADVTAEPEPSERPVSEHVEGAPGSDVRPSTEIVEHVLNAPAREQVYSVPLGKLASRSRMLSNPSQRTMITQRTVSMAMKNMPKNPSRTVSKKPRAKSRRSTRGATPWSLDL